MVRGYDGAWHLVVQPRTRADMWNSQVSLLTGMCAGTIMLDHKIGLLRTVPEAQAEDVDALRAAATALDVAWPEAYSVGAFLAGLDPHAPSTLALRSDATTLLRGSDHLPMLGEIPEDAVTAHGGIAGVHAHVTAPLRRLAARFATCVGDPPEGRQVQVTLTAADPQAPKLVFATAN